VNTIRVLTVDDEPLALRRLKVLLRGIKHVEHVGEAEGRADALAKVETTAPDVVLLDIMMRDGSGFDVVERLSRSARTPVVIFVTAFDQFAIRAFDSSVADYLLKPVERDRLLRALERASQRLAHVDAEQRLAELQIIVRQLRDARREPNGPLYDTEFWVRTATGLVQVPVDAIEVVGSEDEYISLRTASGSHLIRSSLRQFCDRVEPGLFVRVHRKWLVRRSSIAELSIRRMGRPEVVLRSGTRLPAGRVYLKALRQILVSGGQ
jgi:two-component system LytT family response regulator